MRKLNDVLQQFHSASGHRSMKRNSAWFLLALVMLPLLVYLPTLKHELIWDSKPMILENDLLKGEFSLSAPFRSGYWASTSQKSSGYDYYRPLMILSFMIEKAVWGLDPFRLRLVNLLIFIAGLFILYFFLSRQTPANGIAETAVLLFALFPLHLDNITWVVGRCDLLMLFFGLLALYLFDLFLARRSVFFGLLAVASYLLALFSKEAALFFLPLFLLHELCQRKRSPYPLHAILPGRHGFILGSKVGGHRPQRHSHPLLPLALGKRPRPAGSPGLLFPFTLSFHFATTCSCLSMRFKPSSTQSRDSFSFTHGCCMLWLGRKKSNTSRPGYGSLRFWPATC